MQFRGGSETDFYLVKADHSAIYKVNIAAGVMTATTTAAAAILPYLSRKKKGSD